MTDYQRIVDDVRSSLYASGPEAPETVRLAAEAYKDACTEVNQRLRRCGELLKSGLRSEAIQQCEIEPNLLDVVATLDFPERNYWAQRLALQGIAVPAALQMDVAADLNEAYAIEQPIETLLARHRLLALAHSPLSIRIKTLRDLADVDGNNPVWREDLLLYERERHNEIQQEAKAAVMAGDVAAVAKLDKELQGSSWIETPSDRLVQSVSQSHAKLLNNRARTQLEQVERELNDAYSAFDADRGRQLRDQWNTVAKSCGLAENDPLWQRAAPALEWLAREDALKQRRDEQAAALAMLAGALDDRAAENVLERLFHAAIEDGGEVPAALETRYRTRIATLQAAARRRRRWKLAGAASAALIAIAFSVFTYLDQSHKASVVRHSGALKKLLDGGQLAAGEQYLAGVKQNEPQVAASAEINDLGARLKELTDAERVRSQAFEIAVGSARDSVAAATDWQSLAQAQKVLGQARPLAKLSTETAEVERLGRELRSLDRKLQATEDKRFDTDLAALTQRIEALERAGANASSADRQSEIAKLRADAIELKKSRVGPTLLGRVDAVVQRTQALEDKVQLGKQSSQLLAQIARAAGNASAYKQAIDAYTAANPDTPRAGQFRRAIEEVNLWDGLAKYNELAIRWGSVNSQQLDARSAKELGAATKALTDSLSDFPDTDAYRNRLAFIQSIVARADDKGDPIERKLRSQFTKPWMSELPWKLERTDGARFYFKAKPNIVQGPNNIRYVANFDLSEKGTVIRADDVDATTIKEAPQIALAKKALQLLGSMETCPEPRWERTFIDLVQAIYRDDSTDPLLRLVLLQQVLDIGCQGSRCLEIAFEPQHRQLQESNVNLFANWIDPNDQDAKLARGLAKTSLNTLPNIDQAADKAIKLWESTKNPIGKSYRCVGVLLRDDDKWQCSARSDLGQSGDLFIVRRDKARGQVAIERIGRMEKGKMVMLPAPPSEALVEGRWVFAGN